MSLLDKASLIITPNAYKESKLYSIVPSDASGDLDVTRATTATRVNSSGLIEVVPPNLLTYSNTFTNAVWTNAGYGNIATVITNDIISPDGLMNGSKITFSAGVTQARLIQQVSVINGGIYQASIFVKYGNKNIIDFYCDTAIIGLFASFNFTTKILTGSGVSNTIVTELPNGWFRLQYTYTAPSTTSQIGFISNIGSDGFVYAYGAQLEQGATATEYFPTTTRLNIPRIDYSNGSCPSILVEPQRTNLLTYSQDFSNAIWAKDYAIINSNSTLSPDGTNNANKLIAKNVNDIQTLYSTLSLSNGNNTFSIYVKKAEYSKAGIRFGGTANNATIAYDLDTNEIIFQGGNIVSSKIINLSNNWKRIILTANITNAFVAPCIFGIPNSAYSWDVGNLPIYTGNGTSGIYIWGAQFEAGSYETSYIPTTSASVTRNADTFTVNLQNTNMTFCAYLELKEPTLGSNTGDWLQIFNNVSILGRAYGYAQAVGFADAYVLGATASTSRKIIWKQESGTTAKIFLDGVLVATSTTGTYSNPFNRLGIFGEYLSKPAKINSFIFFDNNLTDAECIALTTL